MTASISQERLKSILDVHLLITEKNILELCWQGKHITDNNPIYADNNQLSKGLKAPIIKA